LLERDLPRRQIEHAPVLQHLAQLLLPGSRQHLANGKALSDFQSLDGKPANNPIPAALHERILRTTAIP
jgi:hypothetical protein